MAENRETKRETRRRMSMEQFFDYIERKGERRKKREEEVAQLRAMKTKGFSFITNGNIGGAVGLALAGWLLTNSVKWGENWKDYGKKEFYSWKGMRGKGSEIRKAFAGVGKG